MLLWGSSIRGGRAAGSAGFGLFLGFWLFSMQPALAQPAKGAASRAQVTGAPEKAAKPDVVSKGKSGAPSQAGAAEKKPGANSKQPGQKGTVVPGIHCPNGALEDPHRGFVRCLFPEEKGAPWLPPPPERSAAAEDPKPSPPAQAEPVPAPPKPAPETKPEPAPAVSAEPPSLEIKPLKFENGEVPAAEKALGKISKDICRCVADKGGMPKASGTLKIQFLVRAQGKAEGVEVLSSQGIAPEAGTCIQKLLKNRSVGHPTSDPVGVTVVLQFKRAGSP